MKAHTKTSVLISALLLASTGSQSLADTHYVDKYNPTPIAPYATWGTAATNIQNAVNVASSNDTILIADGWYTIIPEISVTNTIELRSVNGSEATILDATFSNRVLNLNSSASLIEGLTIRRGYAKNGYGGGVRCSDNQSIVTNCVLEHNYAVFGAGMARGKVYNSHFYSNHGDPNNYDGDHGGGMWAGIAYDSLFDDNEATYGAGLAVSVAYNCIVTNNRAEVQIDTSGYGTVIHYSSGGGMDGSTAYGCTVSYNSSHAYGGGLAHSTAHNSTIADNAAISFTYGEAIIDGLGGGSFSGTADNCTIQNNTATKSGGGAHSTKLISCTISNNSATYGGGMYRGTATNCTLIANSAVTSGGGVYDATVFDSHIMSNTSPFGGGILYGTVSNCTIAFNTATTTIKPF